MEYPENADPLQDSKHLAAKQMCNCPQVTDEQLAPRWSSSQGSIASGKGEGKANLDPDSKSTFFLVCQVSQAWVTCGPF